LKPSRQHIFILGKSRLNAAEWQMLLTFLPSQNLVGSYNRVASMGLKVLSQNVWIGRKLTLLKKVLPATVAWEISPSTHFHASSARLSAVPRASLYLSEIQLLSTIRLI